MNREISCCGVCESTSLEMLWDLPSLPLTEKYGKYNPHHGLCHDQKLLFCNQCGHVQLGTQIAPSTLYAPAEYSFRTSQSQSALAGTTFFLNFFDQIKGERKFHSLLDIGGNDLVLAKQIEVQKKCVIDPVLAPQDCQAVDNIKIYGRFIEEVDFKKEKLEPDLIFSRHVLEHIANPRELLMKLFQEAHSKALYIFEIPCFENLVEAGRFDAIFHQHYHYFDLFTLRRLIEELGGEYLAHTYNRQGSCGGALLIAFQKAIQKKLPPSFSLEERKKKIKKALFYYEKQMELLALQLSHFKKEIYGYGASLMLATLGYHLKSDLSELICILDDDPQKEGIGYQNVFVEVKYSKKCSPPPNSNYLITSLENSRSIFKKIIDLQPRRVLLPLIV